MAHPRRNAALAAGGTLALALALGGCSDGGGETNNGAMSALESGFGNAADPSAVETMGNGAEGADGAGGLPANDVLGNGSGAGNETGAGNAASTSNRI